MDILSIYNHKPFFLQFFFSLHPEQQQWSTFLRSASSSSPQQHPVVPQRSRQGASALQGRAFLFPVLQYHPQSIMKTHLHHCFYNHTRLVQSCFFWLNLQSFSGFLQHALILMMLLYLSTDKQWMWLCSIHQIFSVWWWRHGLEFFLPTHCLALFSQGYVQHLHTQSRWTDRVLSFHSSSLLLSVTRNSSAFPQQLKNRVAGSWGLGVCWGRLCWWEAV